jgi:hypothetical protein
MTIARLRHSGHLKINYFGFYPVIEASLDVNDRDAYQYTNRIVKYKGNQYQQDIQKSLGIPHTLSSKLKIYICPHWTSLVVAGPEGLDPPGQL